MKAAAPPPAAEFVRWFRSVAPYVNAFRGRTFVVAFGGEAVADGKFVELTHDFALLASVGIRLVLVHGARPQIEARMRERGAQARYVQGLRVTDELALQCVKEAVGRMRLEIEALLSMGSPGAGARIRVAGGNFVTARPIGVIDGVDLLHTGQVRRVDADAVAARLAAGEVVLLSPLGFSPTGEAFNLAMEDVAAAAAMALKAEKLIFLGEATGVLKEDGELARELTASDAEALLKKPGLLAGETRDHLEVAVRVCREGVGRVHLISRHVDGAILLELFTHEGTGTMVTAGPIEALRGATIDDIGGVLKLIEPLEAEEILVKRGRELLEREIDRFLVAEHDGMIVGCAALYPFPDEKAGELACLAVHPDYQNRGYGEALLRRVEARARRAGLEWLFVLTTRTAHWFVERGFVEQKVNALPRQRQALYNLQRRSKVFAKRL